MSAKAGHVTGVISAAALSFIVHEPSGIIARSSAMSLSASRFSQAHHRRLGAVLAEARLGQEDRGAVAARVALRRVGHLEPVGVDAEQRGGHGADLVGGRRLVERHADAALVEGTQVEARVEQSRRRGIARVVAPELDLERVERRLAHDVEPARAQGRCERVDAGAHPPRDAREPVGAVVARVQRRHDRE